MQGRLFQEAFYLFTLATAGIVLAITMNRRNSHVGFWATALILAVADVPFILFALDVPFWQGAFGPALWIVGMTFTGVGQASANHV